MRRILIVLLMLGLAFSVGGGGGGGSTLKTFALEQKFACPGNVLTVTASNPNGPLSGVNLDLTVYASGQLLKSATTDASGQATFTLDQDGAYKVTGRIAGYNNANLLATIKACATEPAETFFCEDGDLKARVLCVMNLPDSDVLNVHFIPEECRSADNAKQQNCIETYKVLETCRDGIESDLEREMCIKPKLNLSANISDDVGRCGGDSNCMAGLRERVFTLVKFRIYNLIYKAEKFRSLGMNESEVVDFVAYIEDAKSRFNSAPDIPAKKAIVSEIKTKWDAFKDKAKTELGVSG